MNTRLLILLLSLTGVFSARAAVYLFDGEVAPHEGAYGSLFTTVGGGPHSSYFPGTSWTSDGDILTINTIYPNYGVWFGRTDAYGDPAGFDMGTSLDGNRVEATIALGAASSEWSLYWYDTEGFGAGFYFLSTGFEFYYNDITAFVAVADMTAFHTYGAHVHDGEVVYYFDGNPIASGSALVTGTSNFLVIGDGTGSTYSGSGSMRIDSMTIDTAAGAIPEPGSVALLLGGLVMTAMRRRL